jgi:hypothetical protein
MAPGPRGLIFHTDRKPLANKGFFRGEIGGFAWDHLNLILPVYFDLMRQFSCISPEGAREVFLN